MSISILSFGDEYTVNPCRYLTKIAKCDGIEITAGSLIIPDGTLKKHRDALHENDPCYRFEYYKKGSVRVDIEDNYLPMRALMWEEWDYITLQQGGDDTEKSDSFFPYLNELESMIKEACPSSSLVLNETWQFRIADKSGRSQKLVDEMSRNSYVNAAKESGINIVFPVGEAFRESRGMKIGGFLASEGCYGSRMGEFLAGAIWYEMLTGNDITKNKYRLPFIESEHVEELKVLAHSVAVRYSLHK